MSDNEKKSSLAEILEEYFPGAGEKAERILNEVFSDYEPEKTKISENEASDETITDDGLEEFEDIADVPDEPFEVPETEDSDEAKETESLSTLSQWSDWADETIAASAAAAANAAVADNATFSANEESTENKSDDNETEENEVSDETEDVSAAEESSERDGSEEKRSVSEEAPKIAEKDEITEKDDINEKWLTRFAKGIFPVKGDSVFEVIRKIIFLAAIIVFIGAGVMLVSTLMQSKKAVEEQSEARSLIETTVATTIDEDGNVQTIPPTKEEQQQHNEEVAQNYKEINEDYIGYLELAGCEIFEPVVKGTDNDHYLRNNIYGEQNKAGAIFMDYRCTVTPEYTSPNIVIYGHNQEDGTMFGRLKYYKVDYSSESHDIDFYKNNPVIKFNPEFENNEYLIYGFFVTNALANQDSNGEVFHYHDYIETLNDEYTFNWYQDEVQKRNQIISPVDVEYGDKLLVLSTCSNEFSNSRFVVFARKLRDGESVSDYDFSEARINPYAKGVDWEAIMSGETSDTEASESEEILEETTTHRKSINKRNEKTYTTASEEEEPAAETTTGRAVEAAATVTTVPESETSGTETETAGSSESSAEETTVPTEESGGDTDTDSETEESDTEAETTSRRKKRTETSEAEAETSEAEAETSETTSSKKSKKSNR